MAVMVVAGGQGVVLGPAVGALVFTFVPELLRMAAFYRMLLYGVILLLVVMFMPRGLVHYFRLRAGAPIPDAAPDEAIAALGVDDAGGARGGPALAVRDVTVRFGGLAAVEGLSLELGRGEILALIGPNGAGQVHRLQRDHGVPAAGRAAGSSSTARRSPGCRRIASPSGGSCACSSGPASSRRLRPSTMS